MLINQEENIMSIQQDYKHDANAKADRGNVLISWDDKTLLSREVYFYTMTSGGVLFANQLAELGTIGTDMDSFVVCLKSDENLGDDFSQEYDQKSSEFRFKWVLLYKGVFHYPIRGTITGTFSNIYRKLEAKIIMVFSDETSAVINFNAEKI